MLCGSLIATGGCRSDGRELREPEPGQDASISTLPPETTPSFDDPDFITTGLDSIPLFEPVLRVTAPWRDGQRIDDRHTCEGPNVAPPLAWADAPSGTVEIAISLVDLDAPTFVHWVIAGLSPDTIALDEDMVPLGAYEALNGLGDLGYTGPCPPAGSTHTYVVTVHYLGDATGLDDGSSGSDLLLAINSTELASAEVTGTFSRP